MALRKFENDEIVTTGETWWGNKNIVENISLYGAENPLTTHDIEPFPLYGADGQPAHTPHSTPDKPAVWSLARCTDNGHFIGAPYNPATFQPVTNAQFLSLVEKSIAGTAHRIVSAGTVRNRGRAFLSLELRGMEKFKAAGREFSSFLNYGNGHDKSSVLFVNTSNVCTVCDNTFTFNLVKVENKDKAGASQTESADEIKLRIRHTKNVALRFPDIANLIDKAIGVQAEFALAMEAAAAVEISESKVREVFAGFVSAESAESLSTRAENTVDRLAQLWKGGAGNRGKDLADAFNAVTDYYTHESSGGDNRAKQFLSSEYGAGATRKADFLRIIRDGSKLAETAKRGADLLATL